MKTEIASSFNTGKFHGYNVKYSPRRKNMLACAAAENYGIAGKGCLLILDVSTREQRLLFSCEYIDGLFDVAWSEVNEDVIVTCSSNSFIQLWDISSRSPDPISHYKIHEKDVTSVDWNPHNTYGYILSASWDHTAKIYDPFVGKEAGSFLKHSDQVSQARWSYDNPQLFATASSDHTLIVWDIRLPQEPCGVYPHVSEVLCCDWSRMNPDVIATGTVDGTIWEWDYKKMDRPLAVLSGHEYAIRQVKFSPLQRGTLASVSYDFTTRFWNWNVTNALQIHKSHTEFVTGLDYNPLTSGQCCDCAWDSVIHLYNEIA